MEKKSKSKDISIIENIRSLETFFKSEFKLAFMNWKDRVKYDKIFQKKYPNYKGLNFIKKLGIINNAKLKQIIQDEYKRINSLYEKGGEGKIEQIKDLENIIEIVIIKEIQLELEQKNKNKINNEEVNKKINNVLEEMCISGEKIKNQIKKDKQEHPEKYIPVSQALKMEKSDIGIFALALLSKNLENMGIETAIVKNKSLNEEKEDIKNLQYLVNGMMHKKKFDLHFELGEKRNNELIENKIEYEKFKKN